MLLEHASLKYAKGMRKPLTIDHHLLRFGRLRLNRLHQACVPATHGDRHIAKLEFAKQLVPDANLVALRLFIQQNDVLPFIGDSCAFHFA